MYLYGRVNSCINILYSPYPTNCLFFESHYFPFEFILQWWTHGKLKFFRRLQVCLAIWKRSSLVHWSTPFKFSKRFFFTHTLERPWLRSFLLCLSKLSVSFFFQESLLFLVDLHVSLCMNCLLGLAHTWDLFPTPPYVKHLMVWQLVARCPILEIFLFLSLFEN